LIAVKRFWNKETGYKNHIDSRRSRCPPAARKTRTRKKTVANLFQPDELVNEMRLAFPELKTAPLGVARVPSSANWILDQDVSGADRIRFGVHLRPCEVDNLKNRLQRWAK